MRAPCAEPRRDILAQFQAVADPGHPKRAMFVAPVNKVDLPPIQPLGLYMGDTVRGTLVTDDAARCWAFGWRPYSEALMAALLDYPENKAEVCTAVGAWRFLYRARIVQAREPQGNVIIEALTSSVRLADTKRVFAGHGRVVVMNPVLAIARRVARRLLEKLGA
jgi:hypothetical protein